MIRLYAPHCLILASLLAISASAAPAALPTLKLICSDAHGLVTGQETTVTVKVAGIPSRQRCRLETSLEDFDGEVVKDPPAQLTAGRQASITRRISFDRYGAWMFRAAMFVGNSSTPAAEARMRLVRPVPPATLTAEQLEASPIGINIHLNAPWKLFADVGIHWARDYTWGVLRDGSNLPYGMTGGWANQTDFRKVAADAHKAGVMILAILQGGFRTPDGKFFTPDTDRVTTALAEFSKTFPTVKYWELDNEADLQHRGNPEAMAQWMESYRRYIPAAAKGLRRAKMNDTLVLNGDAGIIYDRNKELLDSPLADDFAVINCHFYTGSIAPEISVQDFNTAADNPLAAAGFLDRLRQFAALGHAHGKQVWFTETGWDETNGPAVGTRNQALFLSRLYLLGEFCRIDKTFWFFDRDTGGEGIFSTMGLVDKAGNVRFFAATLAAVSKFIATAEYAGSIDLGADRWCLVFRTGDGKWMAAAWTVKAPHDLPAELAGAEAYDVFGNPAKPTQLSDAVAYYFLANLPAGWKEQMEARLLSNANLTGFPGGHEMIELKLSEGAAVAWDLPAGVTAKADPQAPGRFVLQYAPDLANGEYAFTGMAKGPAWQKTWRFGLRVIPPLQLRSQPYLPGETAEIDIASNAATAQVSLSAPAAMGTLSPTSLTATSTTPQKVNFQASTDAAGPIRLAAELADGAVQEHWLRPQQLDVPRLTDITIDGDLSDWPAAAGIDARFMELNSLQFRPTGLIGWSDKGLYLAATIPFREAISGRPTAFWNFPGFELFIDSDAAPHDVWPVSSHQFWFMPMVHDGKLTVNVGEFKRHDGIKKTNHNVQGITTGVRVDGSVAYIEVFVPTEKLGAAPKLGATWRAVLAYQDAKREEYHLAGTWPQSKQSGLLSGTAKWGLLRFAGPAQPAACAD